jgi:hypothetical protein
MMLLQPVNINTLFRVLSYAYVPYDREWKQTQANTCFGGHDVLPVEEGATYGIWLDRSQGEDI